MTSFDYAVTPTCGNWFHTNQPEHESDDRLGNTLTSEEDMALQRQFLSIFVTLLWFSTKTEIMDGTGIFVHCLWRLIVPAYKGMHHYLRP